MAAPGTEPRYIKGDADESVVELTQADRTYTHRITRRGSTVVAGGEPFIEDPELAYIVAVLLRSNEARQSVASRQDRRDVIVGPIDTEVIENEVADRRLELEGRREWEDEYAEGADSIAA